MVEERYHATTQNRFYPDMSNVNKNITVEAKLMSPPTYNISGFGGAEIACWPLIPKFAGSNPAEAVGFLKGR